MKMFDPANGMHAKDPDNLKESIVFRNMDRIQLDGLTSTGITEVQIMHKVDKDAKWVLAVDPITPAEDSEVYIIRSTKYQKVIVVGGNDTVLGFADNAEGKNG